MRTYVQKPVLILSLEKDDQQNPTGMQMRAWTLNNGTTILVRFLKHAEGVEEKLWVGQKNNGEVKDFVLSLLKDLGHIKEEGNWNSLGGITDKLEEQDEYEEKGKCIYFSWIVKSFLINF